MIAKKNSSLDLEKKRTVLFQIGLLTASSFTLAAFTYRTPLVHETEKRAIGAHEVSFQTEVVETPKIEVKVQDTQQQSQQQTQLDLNVEPDERSESGENSNTAPDPGKIGSSDLGYKLGEFVIIDADPIEGEIFENVDVEARYVGGREEMVKFISENIVFPDDAKMFGDQGTVYVSFVIEKDGSVTNVGIERGVTNALDREAKKVVRSFPKWIPAEINFAKVRTIVRLPIVFGFEE